MINTEDLSWVWVQTPRQDLSDAIAARDILLQRTASDHGQYHNRSTAGAPKRDAAYVTGCRAEIATGRFFAVAADITGPMGHPDVVTSSGAEIEVKGTTYKRQPMNVNPKLAPKDNVKAMVLVYLYHWDWALMVGWCRRHEWVKGRQRKNGKKKGQWYWIYERKKLRGIGDLMKREMMRPGGRVSDLTKCRKCASMLVLVDAEPYCPYHMRMENARRRVIWADEKNELIRRNKFPPPR